MSKIYYHCIHKIFIFAQIYATHKYYKHLVFRETPYAPTKGRNPISEEMAMKENHFKLTYDDADRLVKIEYRIGEQLISPGRIALMGAMYDVAPSVHIKYYQSHECL